MENLRGKMYNVNYRSLLKIQMMLGTALKELEK